MDRLNRVSLSWVLLGEGDSVKKKSAENSLRKTAKARGKREAFNVSKRGVNV